MKNNEKILKYMFPIISVGCILLIWGIASIMVNSSLVLPSILETLKATFNLFRDKVFYSALLSTLIRGLIAFVISFILALILAILSNVSKNAKSFIMPIISIIRALPTIAIALLLYFWFSNSFSPVIVTMLVVLPTSYANLLTALGKIDGDMIETCKYFNCSKKDIFFKVKMPVIRPDIYRAIGTGLTLNLKLMVAAEVLSQTSNCMGYLLNTAKIYYEISLMFALVLVTVIIGLIIETIFNIISKKVDYANKY